jgi:hypothetical protein
MLKRILILLVLALSQWGCDINYGENLYPLDLRNLEEVRPKLEREKREFLKIEDLEIGKGAIASWGPRLKADIEVRYADDGTTIYKGPIVTYEGFAGLLPSDLHDRFMLNFSGDGQPGIQLGLNGMAVGGKRRITISPELVCGGNDQGCYLLRPERQFVNEIGISKKALIVEATLTESCAPIRFRWRGGSSFTLVDVGAGCRTKREPKAGGSDWHIY